jgi:universal stress protein A
VNIVAAIDDSKATVHVLERAIRQARQSQDTLHVIHVFHPPAVYYSMADAYEIDDTRIEEAEADAVWELAAPMLHDAGVQWVRKDLRGYPPASIVNYADEAGADMILIGNRGRGDFLSLALGSTSHGVIHDARCDVLVVKVSPEQS